MDGAKQLKRIFDMITLFFGASLCMTLCLGGLA